MGEDVLERAGAAKVEVDVGGVAGPGHRGTPAGHGHAATPLAHAVREHSHAFIKASRHYEESIVTRQAVQARLADSAIYLHAWACVLARLDADLRAGKSGPPFEQDRAASLYFMDTARRQVRESLDAVFHHDDESMLAAANATLAHFATLPNDKFAIHEASPNARGTGRPVDTSHIPRFPGDPHDSGANGNGAHSRGVGYQPASRTTRSGRDREIASDVENRMQS